MDLLFFAMFILGLGVIFWRPKLSPYLWWILGSILLLSLMKNRNIRYALPILPACAVLSVSWVSEKRVWPKVSIIVLCGFYGILALYFPGRIQQSVVLFGKKIPLITGYLPMVQDWKHQEIIDTIAADRRDSDPFARVLVISNAWAFHSQTLNASLRLSGIKGFAFKGPSKRRWFDFAPYILFKTQDRGPTFSLGQINPVAQLIENPPEWFKMSYQQDKKWPLPDGSEVILYRARPKTGSGNFSELFNVSLQEMVLPRIKMTHVKLKAIPLSFAASSVGKYQELYLQCDELIYQDIAFHHVGVRLINPQINIPLYLETQEIQFLGLDRLDVQAQLDVEPLVKTLTEKIKWIKNIIIHFEGDSIEIAAKVYSIPVKLKLNWEIQDHNVTTRLNYIRLAGVPFPTLFFRSETDRRVSLLPSGNMPFALSIKSLQAQGTTLAIASH